MEGCLFLIFSKIFCQYFNRHKEGKHGISERKIFERSKKKKLEFRAYLTVIYNLLSLTLDKLSILEICVFLWSSVWLMTLFKDNHVLIMLLWELKFNSRKRKKENLPLLLSPNINAQYSQNK